MPWNPNTYRPLIRRVGDSIWRPFWEGGVMFRQRQNLEASFRRADSTLKVYNTAGGKKLWAFTYTFSRMPSFYVEQLETWFGWNKGTPSTAPVHLELKPQLPEHTADLATVYTVDILDAAVDATPDRAPRAQILGFSGAVNFAEVAGS